jgi:undecaprenyl diphosphate synthase
MGRKDRLPADVIEMMNDLEQQTAENTKLSFQLCLDYGGRDDLVRAFNKMLEAGVAAADEKLISDYLDSRGIPDPDLIIRTSGEKRTSGIMAYQATYAELYFTDVYFPDFDVEQFNRAILDYSARVRRFGGTAKEDLRGIDLNKLYDPEHPKLHT